MHKMFYWLSRFICICALLISASVCHLHAEDRGYHRVVVLGDPHLPGSTLELKEQARDTINTWTDVDLVAAVGDITERSGSEAEYAIARKYFAAYKHTLAIVGGNHDYIFADTLDKAGKRLQGRAASRIAKLELLKKSFGLHEVYYTKRLGRYLLVFLTTDDLYSTAFTTLSQKQLSWLRSLLRENRHLPTIIFFHGPLEGTLEEYNSFVNSRSYIAQSKDEIRALLRQNKQVFMWVSGHTHTAPRRPSFASPVNLYDGRVMNIHNTDMQRNHLYTNSLYLYPDRVVVKTYDHHRAVWMDKPERTVMVPDISGRGTPAKR